MGIGTALNTNPVVAVVGMATVDYLYVLPEYPGEDTENAVQDHHVIAGGPAGRGAIAAARLGGSVRLLATCGIGAHAEILRAQIQQDSIDARWVVSEQQSQHSAVIVATSASTRSTLWLRQPRADERTLGLIPELLEGADVVLFDCTDEALARAVAAAALEMGVPSVVDTGSFKAFSLDFVPTVDHVIAPRKWFTAQDPQFVSADLPRWSERVGRRVIAATAGREGGHYVATGANVVRSWSAAPVEAVDTCGAGDTFHGAYAWAVGAGLSLRDSVSIATWSAGLKATALGNVAIPSLEELLSASRESMVGPGLVSAMGRK